jgi:hypothetical protein
MSTTDFFLSMAAYLTVPFLRAVGYEWSHSHSSPLRSSPDTTSPMYPDRPIRPLPKRSLRDRMSPEQAASVVFPHHPPTTGPVFNFPYSSGERGHRVLRQGESDHHACHCGHNHSEVDSDEESDHGAPLPASPSYHYSRNASGKQAMGGANAYRKPGSVSSIDGYESFENTNNKKKRKIPNSNMGANTHHTNLSAEMAGMGISHGHDVGLDDGDGQGRYYGSAPSTPQHVGTGISGAGRGRFGRSASGRSERRVLGSSSNLANAKANSKRRLSLLGNCDLVRCPCANLLFSRTSRSGYHLYCHCQRTGNASTGRERKRESAAAGSLQEQRKQDAVYLHLRL